MSKTLRSLLKDAKGLDWSSRTIDSEISRIVNLLVGNWEDDPPIAHEIEDELLWGFVDAYTQGEVEDPPVVAEEIGRIERELPDRKRWYS